MNLTGFRTAVADALTGLDPEWMVLPEPVDALQPPAFLLAWGPRPTRETLSACADTAHLQVVVVPGRLTVEGVYPIWEAMVDAACTALAAARLRPHQTWGPEPEEFGQVTYLTGRLLIRRPVTIEGTT